MATRTAAKSPKKTSTKTKSAPAAPTTSAAEPDLKRALAMAMELMAIRGGSGQEGQVVEYIKGKLLAAGATADDIRTDDAHKRTPLKGEIGNLIFKLPGTVASPRRLLMAHMDTVPVCLGAKPVKKGGFIYSADKTTGLGGDDRAGVAVVLNTALEILERKLPHPPLTFFWPVQEEVGLHGAHYVQLSLLAKPKLAFNWDGGPAEKITMGATGGYRLSIEITGLASHAGGAPEQGVSAIAIAALAIADLVNGGWHGDIRKGDSRGTSNVGVIQGGAATNVVTDHVLLKAEARSHDPKFRKQIVKEIEQAFERAAKKVTSVSGVCGKVKFDGRLDYESFRLADNEPSVLAAEDAIRALGGEPMRAISNGGLDANWMTAHGIPTVTLGCGQNAIHTISEKLEIAPFERACRIALRLATEESGK